jgi:tetratricopeptide (TPR) repeat protein
LALFLAQPGASPGPGGLDEVLGKNPGTWDPDEGPLTVWAKAGSRSATDCVRRADDAANQLRRLGDDIQLLKNSTKWRERATYCPSSPDVLRLAAYTELLRLVPLPPAPGEGKWDFSELDQELEKSREQALGWMRSAEVESLRRGEPGGIGIVYFRSRALLSLGRVKRAKATALEALHTGDVAPWRAYRLIALCEMMEGDLDNALLHARRSVTNASERGRSMSEYVYALILDRAGDTAAAARIFQRWRNRNPTDTRRVLEMTLPTHERLFLRALEAQYVGDQKNSALRLWNGYLERSEPHDAERKLAERHLSELGPMPDKV